MLSAIKLGIGDAGVIPLSLVVGSLGFQLLIGLSNQAHLPFLFRFFLGQFFLHLLDLFVFLLLDVVHVGA